MQNTIGTPKLFLGFIGIAIDGSSSFLIGALEINNKNSNFFERTKNTALRMISFINCCLNSNKIGTLGERGSEKAS